MIFTITWVFHTSRHAVPLELPNAVAADDSGAMGYCWQAASGRFLLRTGSRAGRFLVEDGKRVIIERNPAGEDAMIVFHLLHSVMAAVLRQRGRLVLHASAAATPDGAVVLSGKSGAGKSTTLAALLQRDCDMIADDVTVLSPGAAGRVEVLPGVAQMHLWEDAAGRLSLDISELATHPVRRGKSAVPAAIGVTGTLPLRAVFLLERNGVERLQVSSLAGADKLTALLDCVYGPMLQGEHSGQFRLFSATAEQVAFHRIVRPKERWTVDEVVEVVLRG